ncbi:DUF1929-domain-containing protein [Coniophora puteana RWD-64-598 SS2]|uniref:DUF1929-domain-containing protein n=1 Tax=Coniophora puteana (strain RWD-64-598) TaxID=741705 RepID=A0A5M3M9A2_CONPW|nr:DUF1929-domain-containing protein [Coniophora puteana RWD-64-598 SS2]EIW75862.1 DUF1929-domain-containing protein [Coniophora puteana RWD-64-598 SS2]
MLPRWLALSLASGAALPAALAQQAGSFVQAGNTQVSAMMMFLGNEEKVYMLDKSEANAAKVNGHPAWGSVWDLNTHSATTMDIYSNTFCASGHHLPNGSYVTFGGNSAVGPPSTTPQNTTYDATWKDYDGTRAIRILNPCTSKDNFNSANCQWWENANVLQMQKQRWYSAAEALANGTIVLIGGFRNGGYINRNYPNTDPLYQGGEQWGGAEPTFEFYPSLGTAQVMKFMGTTSGLNAYAHTFLMPSGKMFVQANLSTVLWDYNANVETPLPAMPNGVVRVYPASGGTAMLPLTPANNYTPTIIFCGGSDMPDQYWGNYSWPFYNTWTYPASDDCQLITPEPQDGSAPKYTQEQSMPAGRTMGQFITLPDQTMLMVNGAANGTAGFADRTLQATTQDQMPYFQSLAAGPVGLPALYNPSAPQGQRWSTAGLENTNIARMYHSSAMLLPDASVLIAGSNPNILANTTSVYPTQYTAEIFYPPYFSAKTRPSVSGQPSTLTYGGNPFNLTIAKGTYDGAPNSVAANTTVVLTRGGFTTHGMNMGQRLLQLNNTYTVNSDGSITLHVAQVPPNPNLLTPGPCLLFVVADGIPSTGAMVTVGSGKVEDQPMQAASVLPTSVTATNGDKPVSVSSSGTSHTAIIAGVVGGVAALAIVGVVLWICMGRQSHKKAAARDAGFATNAGNRISAMAGTLRGPFGGGGGGSGNGRNSDTSAFVPLQEAPSSSQVWGQHPPGSQPGGGAAPAYDAGSPYGVSSPYAQSTGAMHQPYGPGSPYSPQRAPSPYRDFE